MQDSAIPGHLRNALAICRRDPAKIVPVPVAGAICLYEFPDTKHDRPDTTWKVTLQGNAVLAFHRESEAPRGGQGLPMNGSKVNPQDVPAEFRELGRPEGAVLTAPYLATTGGWEISSVELTKARDAGELTYRLKVGRAYAYLYTELFRLREKRADRKDEA
jgi:hypothetical protein